MPRREERCLTKRMFLPIETLTMWWPTFTPRVAQDTSSLGTSEYPVFCLTVVFRFESGELQYVDILRFTDPFKGAHINWWCNGLKGCLLWPSLRPCEVSKSNVPPKRLLKCIDDNLPKPKACPITDFEIQKNIESTQDMQRFWLDIVLGDVALGVVGTAGALGWLGGGAAAGAPKPLPFPNPAPQPIPIPVKPAA